MTAMDKWDGIVNVKRLNEESPSDGRSDYDRLIFSTSFRRLQDKTQVFPLPGCNCVHNRMTHSLEVASVGRLLGREVAERIAKEEKCPGRLFTPENVGDIVAAACLAHDLGNPPFGHQGERAIRDFFKYSFIKIVEEADGDERQPVDFDECCKYLKKFLKYIDDEEEMKKKYDKITKPEKKKFWRFMVDVTHFDGNPNTFRTLAKGWSSGGLSLTKSTIASILKYPYSSLSQDGLEKNKFGFFDCDSKDFEKIAEILPKNPDSQTCCRYPLVYLVEAADDICYLIMDLEDAYKLKIVSFEETKNKLLKFFKGDRAKLSSIIEVMRGKKEENEKIYYLRNRVIDLLKHECVEAFVAHRSEILEGRFDGDLVKSTSEIIKTAYQELKVFSFEKIYHCEAVINVDLSGCEIIHTLLKYYVEAVLQSSRYRNELLKKRASKQFDFAADYFQDRIMAVVDWISGMTDVFALDLFQKIKAVSLPVV